MRLVTLLVTVAMASVLAGPAVLAQEQPYPPGPPPPAPEDPGGSPEDPDGSTEADVHCELIVDGRLVACRGEGFLPGSTATFEVRVAGAVVHAVTVTADADGNVAAEYLLPCEFDEPEVELRLSGTDAEGEPVFVSDVVSVLDAAPCSATDSADGPLPTTGRNVLALLTAALVLVSLGVVLTQWRRRARAA